MLLKFTFTFLLESGNRFKELVLGLVRLAVESVMPIHAPERTVLLYKRMYTDTYWRDVAHAFIGRVMCVFARHGTYEYELYLMEVGFSH